MTACWLRKVLNILCRIFSSVYIVSTLERVFTPHTTGSARL
jgi:hypothetical protein